MARISRKVMRIGVSVGVILAFSGAVYAATYYPDDGDLRYDGATYAGSYLRWNNPGGWSVSDPGYEHDLKALKYYFVGCTTWTDLPYGYDDCPTAGIRDPEPYWIFSFGSFHIANVRPGWWYMGSWYFQMAGAPSSTDFNLSAQEVMHAYGCYSDSIWCMKGTPRSDNNRILTSGAWIWGRSWFGAW